MFISIFKIWHDNYKFRMSKIDKYLTKKNIPTDKTPSKSVIYSTQKIQNTQNTHNLQQIKTQKQSHIEPPREAYHRAPSTNTQANSVNSILNVIQLKKSISKQHRNLNNVNSSYQREEEKPQAPAQPKFVFPQEILIGPFDILQSQEQLHKLQQLMIECNKSTIVEWIKGKNQGKDQPKDFRNVQFIKDEQFWCIDMQRIIELLIKQQKMFNSCIRMLPHINYSQSITFTRKQLFLLISSMFLCILPPQMNNSMVSFAQLMAMRPIDQKYKQKPPVRLQKLKCVINFLKFMLKKQHLLQEEITFQRVFNTSPFYKKGIEKPLYNVFVKIGKIQSGYSKGLIIDFANANVGGGFLTNGCAQQEILFSIFPQMIVTKLLCQGLKDEEAVIVHGARRINNYEGYSHNFTFRGSYRNLEQDPYSSCIIAVDAIDFSKGVMNKAMQYGQRCIRRELHKLHLGIKAACQKLKDVRDVYTGRWGCGVFGADEYLKFCIQWIVCSEEHLNMHFFTEDEKTVKQLTQLFQNMKHLSTLDLITIIESFGKNGGCSDKDFLDYLKYYV